VSYPQALLHLAQERLLAARPLAELRGRRARRLLEPDRPLKELLAFVFGIRRQGKFSDQFGFREYCIRVRILEIETFGRGGLIHYAYNLSCALAEHGHEVTLMTTAGYELEGRSLPANLCVVKPIARISQRADAAPLAFAERLVRKLEAVVDAFVVAVLAHRHRPEIIHLHCTNPIALLYLLLLRLLRIPLVATAHVVTPHERSRILDAAFRRIHQISPLTIAHSEFDRNRLVREFAVRADRIVVIPHGDYGFFVRDAESERPDRDTARRSFGLDGRHEVALFFGYIREYKGLDVLLEAWSSVREARPEARLVVAGDPVRLAPARRQELEAWASGLGAVCRFDYIPFSDVARYFATADVLVMPYRHISQSGVLYLALSLGVPVVATDVGAIPEVLRDNESALLVPPESPTALAIALIRLLGDGRLRERLAQGGREVAEEHSWSSIAERTATAFENLTAGMVQRVSN
jgi:glycosyltransferase involved in cell wall biosynthesis